MTVGNEADKKTVSGIFMFDPINDDVEDIANTEGIITRQIPGGPISIIVRRKNIGNKHGTIISMIKMTVIILEVHHGQQFYTKNRASNSFYLKKPLNF